MKKAIGWGAFIVVAITVAAIGVVWYFQTYIDNAVTVASEQTLYEAKKVDEQQAIYNKNQPVPIYQHSLERDMVIGLFDMRNEIIDTSTVVRSMTGVVEYHCNSLGYGIHYDSSPTAKLKVYESTIDRVTDFQEITSSTTVDQSNPAGTYLNSSNSSATWIFCRDEVEFETDPTNPKYFPLQFESFVSVFPFPTEIDEKTGIVKRSGKSNVNFGLNDNGIIKTVSKPIVTKQKNQPQTPTAATTSQTTEPTKTAK